MQSLQQLPSANEDTCDEESLLGSNDNEFSDFKDMNSGDEAAEDLDNPSSVTESDN